MEAHANVRDMGLIEAKLAYIKGWQALPEFGVSYFVIKMANGKKEVGKSEVQNTVNLEIFRDGFIFAKLCICKVLWKKNPCKMEKSLCRLLI